MDTPKSTKNAYWLLASHILDPATLYVLENVQRVLGANVQKFRTRIGLSQTALGDACGLTKGGIQKIESGKAWPKLTTVKKIAKALSIPETLLYQADHPIVPKPTPREALEILDEYIESISHTKLPSSALGPDQLELLSDILSANGEARKIFFSFLETYSGEVATADDAKDGS